MTTPEFGIIALSPAWTMSEAAYPGVAVAASRAGATGIVDCEYFDNPQETEAALLPLLIESGDSGIRCGIEQIAAFESVFAKMSKAKAGKKFAIICVRDTSFEKKSLKKALETLHKYGISSICECINLKEAQIAESAGAGSVIAKGNESAGRVGEESSFVLLQRFKRKLNIPIWVQGGIGINSAAAVAAAGCAGVILDCQLLLMRESGLRNEQKEKLLNFDGSQSTVLPFCDEQFRVYTKPGDETVRTMILSSEYRSDRRALRELIQKLVCQAKGSLPLCFPLSQDLAFAPDYALEFISTAGLVQEMRTQIAHSLELALKQKTLLPESDFAQSHGLGLPLLQGAMTRVSDTADFAYCVSKEGALPFLALALMRKNEIDTLLADCSAKLKNLPWGVGLLGFVPAELRQEQLEVVLKFRPPCALIAGGRPDQAKELEDAGIKTYLHVPSPALLESFIEMGAKRFIFEGKECGGHVGPRTSFVLWESMIQTLLKCLPQNKDSKPYHVVFAGGIHDELSAAMLAVMSAPLAERGVRIGLLMGTAYLFTKEAVDTGAIVPKFQEAALACEQTVLLETGPGHAIRCLNSPYKSVFDEKRKKLEKDGHSKNEIRQELELMNLGRLRVASKGLSRGKSATGGSKLVKVPQEKQWEDGMYMIGQVAALHDKTTTIKALHKQVTQEAYSYLLSQSKQKEGAAKKDTSKKQEEAIAIVGMSCLFPKANDLATYWQNILNGVDCIEEIPKEQWDAEKLYSKDPLAQDKISSRWGGFLKDIPFDPSIYGIPPASLASVDPMQMLILEVTRAALKDSGYLQRKFPKDRTSIVLANAGHGPITAFYSLRSMLDWTLSDLDPAYRKELEKRLPEWTEDSFPGYLGNVVAGRVANRFDLGGINFCVDAACASSLAALYIGMRELRAGASDMVLLAATDTHNQPGDYLSFSKTHALSPRGRCRTFDATADGIVISEGIAVLVLKRLSDAERDGDRIYALLRGIGGSSDGRDLSLTAPRPAGQMLALERAYENAGISPASVELIEAHGTGTVAGDKAEVEALTRIFSEAGAEKQVCALGSVKTMIGHTKCAAGLASIIKVAHSLYHRVLPPTIGVENPNPHCKFNESPFYLNAETRPWLHDAKALGYPRRAGVSAFGFGGTNFHAVLEEYTGQNLKQQESAFRDLPGELFALRAPSKAQLLRSLEILEQSARKALLENEQVHGPLAESEPRSLFEIAYKHHLAHNTAAAPPGEHYCLALVASSIDDLLKKIQQSKELIGDNSKVSCRDPRGLYFSLNKQEKGLTAFLFPGQGSQQTNMLRDLLVNFNWLGETFDLADRCLKDKFEEKLSRYIYPAPAFSDEERKAQNEKLKDTHLAQPAIAAADMAAFKLLCSFGIKAELFAGHSFGEYAALAAAGALSEEDLYKISEARGRILKAANQKKGGSMAAVNASGKDVLRLISHLNDVTLANLNSPKQCIISGQTDAVAEASKVLNENRLRSKPIAVSAAFHSPLMKPAQKQLSRALFDIQIREPQSPVYSNMHATPYPTKPEQIASLLCEHLVHPVDFQKQIEEMYENGARVFIECGPGSVLSSLVDDILQGKDYLCLSLERNGKNGLVQLEHLLAQLYVYGLDPDLGKLFSNRIDSLALMKAAANLKKPRLNYLINGSHIKRFDGNSTSPANRPTAHSLQSLESKHRFPAIASADESAGSKHNPQGPHSKNAADTQTESGQRTDKRILPPAAQVMPGQIQKASPALNSLPAPIGEAGNSREKVMLAFQRSMLDMTTSFLESQERVMLAYLKQSQSGILKDQKDRAQVIRAQAIKDTDKQESDAAEILHAKQASAETLTDTLPQYDEDSLKPVSFHKDNNGNGKQETNHNECGASTELPPALDPEVLIGKLIEIVSERTGYPREMLDPTLDLEADLGIDSIKRVEILNSFRKLLPEGVQQELENGIEKLAGTKTLAGIMQWIREDLTISPQTGPGKVTAFAPEKRAETASRQTRGKVGRAILQARPLPALLESGTGKLHGLYIISDSEDGLSEELAKKIQAKGAETLILRHRQSVLPKPELSFDEALDLDLCREDLLKALGQRLSAAGKQVSGLIHLLPLNKNYASVQDSDGIHAYTPVRSFFLLSKELLSPLSTTNETRLFACVSLASFGLTKETDFNPIHAGIPGILKSFAREYPNSVSRCLDFAKDISLQNRASALVAELGDSRKTLVEVAYLQDGRISPEACLSPLQEENSQTPELDASSLILVTGGARGITAEICQELAERHKSTFVIVGRGQRPAANEEGDYKGVSGQKELKARIMEVLRRQGKALSIPAVETIYQRIVKEREIRDNLKRLESTGSRVHYHSLDVRDKQAFSELIEGIYESFGKIDAVIHGAGVIEDAYMKDKSLASFDRVFGTKIDAALTLSSCLQLDSLKYLIFFSSVVGRTGNAGQCDYVAANEVVNKLALKLNRIAGGRVISLGWGPWRGGMAQAELESVFARFGWSMIEAEDGRRSFYQELSSGLKPDAEVLLVGQLPPGQNGGKEAAHVAGSARDFAKIEIKNTGVPKSKEQSGGNGKNGNGNGAGETSEFFKPARLSKAEFLSKSSKEMALRVKIDPEVDIYLKDHQFDGTPVLPMAVACELMAEAAQMMYPQYKLQSLQNLDIPSGIMFERGGRDLFINLTESSHDNSGVRAQLTLATSPNSSRKNFIVQASLGNHDRKPVLPELFSARFQMPALAGKEDPPGIKDIYTNWLFHGPLFQGIKEINALAQNGIAGQLIRTPIENCLSDCQHESWLIDPLLLDSAMQLAGVWARHFMDITVLPTGFKSLHILDNLEGDIFKAIVFIPEESKNGQLLCDLALYNEKGDLILAMQGLGGVGSKAFNRLAKQTRSLRSH